MAILFPAGFDSVPCKSPKPKNTGKALPLLVEYTADGRLILSPGALPDGTTITIRNGGQYEIEWGDIHPGGIIKV